MATAGSKIRVHYQEELFALEDQAMAGFDFVLTALDRTMEAVENQDVELAQIVMADDDKIDGRYLEVHQGLVTLLATQSPVATDLRLIAALLHSPEVLLLDEPTIGLDVVSQRNVQEFLRYYQAERKITVILTSHYMKDVEALCKRAIIINDGEIKHDGPLSDIIDRFSQHKIIQLQFAAGET
ncbi:MAG: PhoU domain-containing protein, partial [Solirubrobacterales bacterium]